MPEKTIGCVALFLGFFDRCANACSLNPPQAAFALVAANSATPAYKQYSVRVERQNRTPFLKADFHSDFVKILANTASIGCVFAASDPKSALEKSSTSMGGDFEEFVSQSGEGRLSPFKNDWGRKTRNIPH